MVKDIQKLISEAKNPGFDWNGTADLPGFPLPPNPIIITGVKEEDKAWFWESAAGLNLNPENVYLNDTHSDKPQLQGMFKARKCRELKIDRYFDNDPVHVYWIKKYAPELDVVYIHRRSYIIFTKGMDGITYGVRLKEEGNNVIMAILPDEKEDPEILKRRATIGDGLIDRYPADKVIKLLSKIPDEDRDEYFIDWDFNYSPEYADKIRKIPGVPFFGLMPTKEGRALEDDRHAAQEFVNQNYLNLEIPEEMEFKAVEEAIAHIEEGNKVYVVKCNGDHVTVFVPEAKEFKDAIGEIKSHLESNKSELEKEGFILQEKIINPVEVTPEALFINGKPLYWMVDIENKRIAAGDYGKIVGCSIDLNFIPNPGSKLVQYGLKDYYKKAEEDKLTNWMDASMYVDRHTNKAYFGEFCPERRGYNSFLTELSMLPSVSYFFESVIAGINPFESAKPFGVSIRVFNSQTDEERHPKGGLAIKAYGRNVWLWDVKKDEKDNLVTVGESDSAACITGVGDTVDEAIENVFYNLGNFCMQDMMLRTDFKTEEWYGLKKRYTYLEENGWLEPDKVDDELTSDKKYVNVKESKTKSKTNNKK